MAGPVCDLALDPVGSPPAPRVREVLASHSGGARRLDAWWSGLSAGQKKRVRNQMQEQIDRDLPVECRRFHS